MLASSIQGVVAQALLPKAGGGRVAAFEIMVGTNAVRNLIRENQIAQVYSMIQTGARYGMQTLEDSVNDLLAQNLITEQVAHNALKSGAEAESADDLAGQESALGNGKAAPMAARKGQPAGKGQALGGPGAVKKSPPISDPGKEGYSF
jgi:twitching motility protein PilT